MDSQDTEYIWYGVAALVIVLGLLYVIGHEQGGNGGSGPSDEPVGPDPQPQEQYQ